MRRRARLAAPALALALAAAGCDLVSSLTPFGVGNRKPDETEVVYSGSWSGATGDGGTITFTVSGGQVLDLAIDLPDPCRGFTFEETPLPIEGTGFGYDGGLDPQGTLVIQGTFTSTETATGSFAYEGTALSSGCPASGEDTFSAKKIVQP